MTPFVPAAELEAQTFESTDFTEQDLAGLTFTNCVFRGCDFSRLVLESTRFENGTFVDCNLSNVVVDHTRFDGVVFERCKLVGLNFGNSDRLTFTLTLKQCLLRYANFSQLRWKNAVVTDCDVHDTDFRGAQLVGADFTRSRFRACRFHGADLSRADFSHAEGYDLDPRTETLKKAVFTLPEALNLLVPFDIEVR